MDFREQEVILENGINGIASMPNRKIRLPGVVLLHGFGSNKDEVGGLFARLAAALAKVQIVSLRIDFRGWGMSSGNMSDTTIQGQLEDALVAFEYLSKQEYVQPSRIGVVGFSLGGAIAILSAGTTIETYKSMVLWSPMRDLKKEFTASLGQNNFASAASDGEVTIDLGWRNVTLKNSFFQSLEQFDLQREFKQFKGAFLGVAGTCDSSAENIALYIDDAQGFPKEAFALEGGDHIFGVLRADQNMSQNVINKTVTWFGNTL